MDLARLFDPAASPQFAFQPLMREKLLLVAPPMSKLPAQVGLAALANYLMVLPNAPNAIHSRLDSVLNPRGIRLQVLAEVGAVRTVLALVATGVGCTVLPESALGASGDEALPCASIGPPSIWNALVLATPKARPATRLSRGTAQLLQELDFRQR